MTPMVLRMLLKDQHKDPSWEKLCRILLLNLGCHLREAKADVRRARRLLEKAESQLEKNQVKEILDQMMGAEIEANNAFQGAKEWWREMSPEENPV